MGSQISIRLAPSRTVSERSAYLYYCGRVTYSIPYSIILLGVLEHTYIRTNFPVLIFLFFLKLLLMKIKLVRTISELRVLAEDCNMQFWSSFSASFVSYQIHICFPLGMHNYCIIADFTAFCHAWI